MDIGRLNRQAAPPPISWALRNCALILAGLVGAAALATLAAFDHAFRLSPQAYTHATGWRSTPPYKALDADNMHIPSLRCVQERARTSRDEWLVPAFAMLDSYPQHLLGADQIRPALVHVLDNHNQRLAFAAALETELVAVFRDHLEALTRAEQQLLHLADHARFDAAKVRMPWTNTTVPLLPWVNGTLAILHRACSSFPSSFVPFCHRLAPYSPPPTAFPSDILATLLATLIARCGQSPPARFPSTKEAKTRAARLHYFAESNLLKRSYSSFYCLTHVGTYSCTPFSVVFAAYAANPAYKPYLSMHAFFAEGGAAHSRLEHDVAVMNTLELVLENRDKGLQDMLRTVAGQDPGPEVTLLGIAQLVSSPVRVRCRIRKDEKV